MLEYYVLHSTAQWFPLFHNNSTAIRWEHANRNVSGLGKVEHCPSTICDSSLSLGVDVEIFRVGSHDVMQMVVHAGRFFMNTVHTDTMY